MWITINNQVVNVKKDNFSLDMALSDPLTTASFEVFDEGSTLNLDFNQNVMIWDENAAPDYTVNLRAIQCVPTLNLVNDPSFTNTAVAYSKGGTYSSIIAFTFATASFVFNNQASTGLSHDAHVIQNSAVLAPGYITPGQTYMFSIYMNSSGATNLNYYYQINWLDSSKNYLSNSNAGFTTPPTTQVRETITAVAPANAAYAQIQFGAYATSSTNSGTITFGTPQIEPVWFPNYSMGNGVPISYPTPDCNFYQVNTYAMPDGTYARNNRLFYGFISNLEATYQGTNRTWSINCSEMGSIIENGGINTPIDTTYVGYTDTAIINDIITNYYPGLLSTGQLNSSQPTTTLVPGPVIDSVSFSNQTFREILNNLSDLTGYAYSIDPYLHIRYHPIPYDYALFSLVASASPDYLTTFPPQEYTYIKDGTQIRNSVKVTGGNFTVTVQDVLSGDGATKVFNLSFIPVGITSISENSGSTIYAPTKTNKIGVQGQDVNGVSGVVALMDATSNPPKVTFNTAPASGTNNVVITYTQNRPVAILVEEETSIMQYGRRFVSKVEDSNLASNAAGKVRGESEVAQWAYPVQNITFKLSSEMGTNWQPVTMFLRPGTTVLLTSPLDNLTNQPFVIQTVKISSEGGGVNIYEYEGGVYRPKMNDHLRNVQKALARNPDIGGSTPVQYTYRVLRDQLLYIDTVTATTGSTGIYYWGSGVYGYASFS